MSDKPMSDTWFNPGEQPAAHEEHTRRLVLDAQEEQHLQANLPDGRQTVIQPPVGTVGGPPASGGAETTTMASSVPSGGGPADAARMPDVGDEPTQSIGRGEDTGIGASPNPK